jgi:hypothetical protein
MTVLVEQPSLVEYTANSIDTFYEFDGNAYEDSEITVYIDSILVPADQYTVQLTGINFKFVPQYPSLIRIERATDLNQLRDWIPFGAFEADKTEFACDKLIRLKGESKWRRLMNLYTKLTCTTVTIINDKGTDAVTPLWSKTLDESGYFSATITEQAPPDGGLDLECPGRVWIQFDDVIPPVQEEGPAYRADLVDTWTLHHGWSSEDLPQQNRTHPFAGWSSSAFTMFACFRWQRDGLNFPGRIWGNGPFLLYAVEGAGGYFISGNIVEETDPDGTGTNVIFTWSLPMGNIAVPGLGKADFGDWLCVMLSFDDLTAPGTISRVRHAYVVNVTKGIEYNLTSDIDDGNAGQMAWPYATEKKSRSVWSCFSAGLGSQGWDSSVAVNGFHDKYLDLDQESNRRLICGLNSLPDPGVGGVNIFGEQMMYLSEGHPRAHTGWLNIGNPFKESSFLKQVGEDRIPYDYPTPQLPKGDWYYNNMAAAEASGDAWQDGDYIYVEQGMHDMVYKSALAVDGHMGLRHINPFNDVTTYSSEGVIESQPAGSDPNTWGYGDSSTGTKGVDWDMDVSSGRARFFKITAAGRVYIESPNLLAAGDEVTFAIINDMEVIDADPTNGSGPRLIAGNAATSVFTQLLAWDTGSGGHTPPTDTYLMNYRDGTIDGYEDSMLPWTAPERVWIYLRNDRIALWSDYGLQLVLDQPRSGGAGQEIAWIFAGSAGDSNLAQLLMGYHVFGRLTP